MLVDQAKNHEPAFGGFISDHQVLDFNILDPVGGSDDGTTDQRWKDVRRKVGTWKFENYHFQIHYSQGSFATLRRNYSRITKDVRVKT